MIEFDQSVTATTNLAPLCRRHVHHLQRVAIILLNAICFRGEKI